ncbi:MAG: hypothetical protein ACREHD_35055 [Pirellulales bacterium]
MVDIDEDALIILVASGIDPSTAIAASIVDDQPASQQTCRLVGIVVIGLVVGAIVAWSILT